MILLCVDTTLSLFWIYHSEVTPLIPSETELQSEISIVLGHENCNHYASLKGWMKLFITCN